MHVCAWRHSEKRWKTFTRVKLTPHSVPPTFTPPHLWPLRSCLCSSVIQSHCFLCKGATIQDCKRPLIFKHRSLKETEFYCILSDWWLFYIWAAINVAFPMMNAQLCTYTYSTDAAFSPPHLQIEAFVQQTPPLHTLHARPSLSSR